MCLAIPGQISEIVDAENQIAKVCVSGVSRNVSIALLADQNMQPGDWVLVHVGFAMSHIDEAQAKETLALLESLGDEFEQTMQEFAGEGEANSEEDLL